jgi:hypothetical protein
MTKIPKTTHPIKHVVQQKSPSPKAVSKVIKAFLSLGRPVIVVDRRESRLFGDLRGNEERDYCERAWACVGESARSSWDLEPAPGGPGSRNPTTTNPSLR